MADILFSVRELTSLDQQHAHISQQNPRTATAVLGDIRRTCDLLAEFPKMGRAIEGTRLRYVLSRKYRYRIEGEAVEIHDILHPRQA
ncbi:MAG: type II toxin-antitoxin system RelE/ParE family toxin [Rhodobacterales bacterium]|nr:type II toxin-antitoxin system RelE/ParE family toxin [Rhodobacterales bacterium]